MARSSYRRTKRVRSARSAKSAGYVPKRAVRAKGRKAARNRYAGRSARGAVQTLRIELAPNVGVVASSGFAKPAVKRRYAKF